MFGNKEQWALTYYYKPHCPYCVEFTEDWEKVSKNAKKMGISVREIDTTNLRLGKGVPRLVLTYFNGKHKMEVEF